MLRKMNPLFMQGLTFTQKISYFFSVIVYADGMQRLVFYLAPVVYFLFGILPVKVDNSELLIRLVPYMVLTIGSFELLSRGTGYILISERYNMTRFWTYVMATSGYFAKKPLKFNVTPKGVGDVPFKTYAPQLILAIVSVVALVWALVARHHGWIDYNDGGGFSTAFLVNGLWVGWNLYFALYVVHHSVQSKQLRADYRFEQRLPTNVRAIVDGQPVGEPIPATTEDINSSGVSFRCTCKFDKGTLLELPLNLTGSTIMARGIVTHRTETPSRYGTVYSHGLSFLDMPLEARDAIELHSAHHAIPLSRQQFRQSIDLIENAVQRFTNPRQGRRTSVGLPALVSAVTDDGEMEMGMGLLEDESSRGVRLILENPIEPGTVMRWDVPGTTIAGRGTVVFSRAMESPLRVSFVVGVQRLDEPRDRFATVRRWVTREVPAPGIAGR